MGLSCFANELSTFLQEQEECCEAKGHSYILGHGKKRLVQNKEQRSHLPRRRELDKMSWLSIDGTMNRKKKLGADGGVKVMET
nr:hypothetical protein Iba_chr12bCG17200 [Ipomoea batatas]